MNNGLYVGPIISRNSPRWRMQEITNVDFGTGYSAGLFEPYIPPTVAAVMVTATAGTTGTAAMSSAASCHNVVFPVKDRRFFIEITANSNVYLFLVDEYNLSGTPGSNPRTSTQYAECTVLLGNQTLASNQALVYCRDIAVAGPYITAAVNSSRPFMNGVIAGGVNGSTQSFSLINPRLRLSANPNPQVTPGNLFAPIRGLTASANATPGTGKTDAQNLRSTAYVRLEYLV